MDTASIAAQGPSTIAPIPMPTAWPVVPPGSGKLNIITMKEKAEKTEISGTRLVLTNAFTRRRAIYQNGAAAAYRAAQVDGLR